MKQAGAFFTEGTITKNSPGEVADMMRLLEVPFAYHSELCELLSAKSTMQDWANGRRDSELRVASAPLAAMTSPIVTCQQPASHVVVGSGLF